MSNLIPVNDIQTMALAVVKSGLFGMKTVEQATALMLIAQAEGYHPALAARDYHIIQGRPTLKAETMMARFQQQGGNADPGQDRQHAAGDTGMFADLGEGRELADHGIVNLFRAAVVARAVKPVFVRFPGRTPVPHQ